ncbi:UNVERIFIED_CONTAM: helicase-related protein [Campylobacter lari]
MDGIKDGFLAPYHVIRSELNIDREGYHTSSSDKDIDGNYLEDKNYSIKDYDRNIEIINRTKAVAKKITNFLKQTNRYDKTIVFCTGVDHAERLRQALIVENKDLGRDVEKYVVRITGDEHDRVGNLDNFIDVNSKYPVVVTTSQLLTTGVDCKSCKLIVLDRIIDSQTEFKQIIGRGTRLCPNNKEVDKRYFTILDFRGATKLFDDPGFNGEPLSIKEEKLMVEDIINEESLECSNGVSEEVKRKVIVEGDDVEIIGKDITKELDENGQLVVKDLIKNAREIIYSNYATIDEFKQA